MTTPREWLGPFQVNTGAAATNEESDPRIIGLSNGNFLVAWVEQDGSGGVAGGNGDDIVGKIYDAEGGVVRDSYRLSKFSFYDERDFDIAATNDGGFAMAYIEYADEQVASQFSSVIWQRFDSAGNQIDDEVFVSGESVPSGDLVNPQIAVHLDNNNSVVTWTKQFVGANDILGRSVSATGAPGSDFNAARNLASEFDRDGDLAVLTNGNYVHVYEEEDGGVPAIEFKIFTGSGSTVRSATDVSGGIDPAVASLSNGDFVVVWQDDNDVFFRLYSVTGTLVRGTTGAATGADEQNEPDVVALPDGGFVIVWDDDTDNAVEARAFFADGNADGAQFQVANNDAFDPNVGVTADGRILFTYEEDGGSGEIFAAIWDPRENPIDADDYIFFLEANFVDNDGPVTAQKNLNTTLNGKNLSVTLLGQDGDDTITGGFRTQTIQGGGGNDRVVIRDGEFIDDVDGGAGTDTVDMTDVTTRIVADLEAGTYRGSVAGDQQRTITDVEIFLSGSGDDELTSDGPSTIDAGAGNDTITGGFSTQTIQGGGGNDRIVIRDGEFIDDVDGGTGTDTVDMTDVTTPIVADLEAGTYEGSVGGDSPRTITDVEIFLSGSGDDELTSDGPSTIDAGAGEDLVFAGLGFPETLIGGPGIDTLDTTTYGFDYVVNLATGRTNFDRESFTEFENLVTGAGNDTLTGTRGANEINGGAGDDAVDGGPGNDRLIGGPGSDLFVKRPGESDDVIVDFDPAADRVDIADYGLTAGQLQFRDEAGGTRLLLGDDSLMFEGLSRTAISAGAFEGLLADTDGDGVADIRDNATDVPNPDQRDTDGDGYGNVVDPDLNDDGAVNGTDFVQFAAVFGERVPADDLGPVADADFNGDGAVNGTDFVTFAALFGDVPGPAADTLF